MTKHDFARISVVLCAPMLALLIACSETHNEPAGTNTNWLRSCDRTADCDPEANCLCGVCTRACSAARECADIPESTCTELRTAACGSGSSSFACLAQQSAVLSGSPRDASTDATDAATTDAAGETFSASNQLPAQCEFSFAFLVGATSGSGTGGGGSDGQGVVPPLPACGCTRRSGARESLQCPPGAGQSVTQEVGPAGGTVQLAGTPSTAGVPVELRIPAGALDRTVTIRITETSIAPPDSIADWSPLYHFEPEDLTFVSPVELRMPWTSSLGLVPKDLAIYASDTPGSCALAPLADNYINAGFNQGTLRAFGWAAVGVSSDTCDATP